MDKKLHMNDTCANKFCKQYNEQFLSRCLDSVKSFLLGFLGVPEFQEKQIFVRFEEKPQSEQGDILIYLYLNWQDLQHDSSVLQTLKETRFVTSGDGDLYKPKDLFDPGDALLTSVFSGEAHKFPGERFVSDGWLNILRDIGLQNTDDADILLECARRVEFLGAENMKHADKQDFSNTKAEISLEIWSLAETLIKAIIENHSLMYDKNFCNIFGRIVCIPAEKGSPFISGKKGFRRVLCSYSEAILLKDWPLAWSVSPVCIENLVPPEYSWEALQLTSPPPFTIVIKHLQADLRPESSLFTVEDASVEVLKYLDTIWGTLSSSDISELQKVSFIAADNVARLVTSGSLFTHLTINLSPFASKLPSCYLPFVKILKKLGVEDMLSISCAINILSTLHKSCGYHRLNPNELQTVIELLHFLCNETIDQQTSDRSNWESKLVIPDDACRLVHPNLCVYIDSYGSQYVKYIDSSKIRFVHHDVSERLCLAIGIRKLSDVIVEELDRFKHLRTLKKIGSISLASIRLKLLSRSFQVAVSNVLNTASSSTTGSKTPDFQSVQISLESVAQRLQFVQCIYTRFWLLPKYIDITYASRDSISHRALYFVDRSNTCMLIAEPPSYVPVLDLVAIVVSHVLGSPVPLPIGSLFICPQDSETALVNILKFSSDKRVMDGVDRGTSFLGRQLRLGDSKKVNLGPLRPFYKGEIVAWKSQNGEELKYGRIPEDVRPSADQEFYSFNLETFPGHTETVISSHVYYFGSYSFSYESSTNAMPEDSNNLVSRIHVDQPEGSGGAKLRNQGQTFKELKHGRVSAEELVQEFEEMLSGAGIRMDTEKQYLLQTTLSLQEQLMESEAALLFEQERSKMETKEANRVKVAMLCRNCLANRIKITAVPCGHVLCLPCSSSVSCCPICQVQLLKTMNIYWP